MQTLEEQGMVQRAVRPQRAPGIPGVCGPANGNGRREILKSAVKSSSGLGSRAHPARRDGTAVTCVSRVSSQDGTVSVHRGSAEDRQGPLSALCWVKWKTGL